MSAIGHNSQPVPATVTSDMPEGVKAASFARRFTWARMQRKNATERVKERRGEIKTQNAQAFRDAQEARAAAREMLNGLLLEDAAYKEAAEDRKAASADMRIILKEAEEAGVDPEALKAAIALGDLDSIERAERWDKIDEYAAAMLLWVPTAI